MRLTASIFTVILLLGTAPAAMAQAGGTSPGSEPMKRADFIAPPRIFMRHTKERSFVGPGLFVLESGDLLMAAPWGRPPTNFKQLAAKFPVPPYYRSTDGGRSWQDQGRLKMKWSLSGMISDGGISFLRLQDGRLALLSHRHVKGFKGGGMPVIAFSSDDGKTWTPARKLLDEDGIWYVMNDRLLQLKSGRLVVPVAHPNVSKGYVEGHGPDVLCLLSDDGGKTWRKGKPAPRLDKKREMQEPCVVEVAPGRMLMLARTGVGSNHACWSEDGGETWSAPEPTSQIAACSSLTLRKLPDGRLITFYNHTKPLSAGAFFPRTPLCYAVSADGGRSWSDPVLVDDAGMLQKDRQNIYPGVAFTEEGMVLVWSTHTADPQGGFGEENDRPADDCGGKTAVLAYPK